MSSVLLMLLGPTHSHVTRYNSFFTRHNKIHIIPYLFTPPPYLFTPRRLQGCGGGCRRCGGGCRRRGGVCRRCGAGCRRRAGGCRQEHGQHAGADQRGVGGCDQRGRNLLRGARGRVRTSPYRVRVTPRARAKVRACLREAVVVREVLELSDVQARADADLRHVEI